MIALTAEVQDEIRKEIIKRHSLTDGEQLYAARISCDVTQAELARYLRFHQTAISKMERHALPVHPRVKAWTASVGYTVPINVLLTVYRKRAGLAVNKAGTLYGCGGWRVTEMEAGRRSLEECQQFLRWLEFRAQVAKDPT